MTDWTRRARVGEAVLAWFVLASAFPVVTVSLDLLDDGLAGITVSGDDLRGLRGLGIEAMRAGTFRAEVSATDAAGCRDVTGSVRPVDVSR